MNSSRTSAVLDLNVPTPIRNSSYGLVRWPIAISDFDETGNLETSHEESDHAKIFVLSTHSQYGEEKLELSLEKTTIIQLDSVLVRLNEFREIPCEPPDEDCDETKSPTIHPFPQPMKRFNKMTNIVDLFTSNPPYNQEFKTRQEKVKWVTHLYNSKSILLGFIKEKQFEHVPLEENSIIRTNLGSKPKTEAVKHAKKLLNGHQTYSRNLNNTNMERN
ncbi:4870_t:CDS:2 [Ambispora leptoticha]|uniref:4870_t:CDS:1 n=1 Tax=Ambispora leptoticha TaxID=144679 RepID=A0A9N8VNX7_9GLOM|nr:4870_t:CDS:2 [Ambispora leptoticha]